MIGWSIPAGRISCRFFSTDRLSAEIQVPGKLLRGFQGAVDRVGPYPRGDLADRCPDDGRGRCPQGPPRRGQVGQGLAGDQRCGHAGLRQHRDHVLGVLPGPRGCCSPAGRAFSISSRACRSVSWASTCASRFSRTSARAARDGDAGIIMLLGSPCPAVQRGPGTLRSGHRCPPRPARAWSSRLAVMPDRMSLVTVA